MAAGQQKLNWRFIQGMDAFEQVVGGLLRQNGYWVLQSFKVELTKAEKVAIGRPSSPRWEIDLVAYSGAKKELLAVECKSYLDSLGVDSASLTEPHNPKSRYKLFTDAKLRRIIFNRMRLQMTEIGLIPDGISPTLALAVGKFKNGESCRRTEALFAKKSWRLFGPGWLVEQLQVASTASYFDSVAHVVSKLAMRSRERERG